MTYGFARKFISRLESFLPIDPTLFQVSASFRVSALYFLLAINTKEGLWTNAQYFFVSFMCI